MTPACQASLNELQAVAGFAQDWPLNLEARFVEGGGVTFPSRSSTVPPFCIHVVKRGDTFHMAAHEPGGGSMGLPASGSLVDLRARLAEQITAVSLTAHQNAPSSAARH